ncbi:MAG: hypothetical protein H7A48_13690 [Akkermansiaceae bacterium]|nr:hypothetical protein [Akkermansiaceae bacterium]
MAGSLDRFVGRSNSQSPISCSTSRISMCRVTAKHPPSQMASHETPSRTPERYVMSWVSQIKTT